jgi:hypothetical protein
MSSGLNEEPGSALVQTTSVATSGSSLTYSISFTTARESGAGTLSTPVVSITGTGGTSGELRFSRPSDKRTFQKDRFDHFRFTTVDLGDIKSMVIRLEGAAWHNASKWFDTRKNSWKLSQVMLMDESSTKTWTFPAGYMLLADNGSVELFADRQQHFANLIIDEVFENDRIGKLAASRVAWTDEAGRPRVKDSVVLPDATVRARPGRLSALSVSHSSWVLYGAFVWARRTLDRPKTAVSCSGTGTEIGKWMVAATRTGTAGSTV